ncbi:Hsp20/alpha crystallin family protein [Kiritimatiella glycovorans]|uniref:Heat shock protein Hsp20 n=1 Tax=Kiritimatiella glycovorans TaxID=1307763 RepID=A0A0G3EEY8_9BACT|nr:Hsp20/alpha crystallin family protein [Kiritimatiella glycovorans]AKJ63310.1 heat shock protein Hsp20 [Kiritimatiella glycovorans]
MKNLIPRRRRNEVQRRGGEGYDPFEGFQRRMNELFEDFFGEMPAFRDTERFGAVVPRFEVAETDSAISVDAELPGMKEDDLELTLDGDVLTIAGEKQQESEDKKKNYYVSERSYGRFQRSIPLPDGVDTENIRANFKNGVLHVEVPKTEEYKSGRRTIDITTG